MSMLNIINLQCGIVTVRINTALLLVYRFLRPLNTFLTIAKECIPTREVTIRTDDKMWFDSNLRRESRRRDRLRKAFLRTKTVSAEKQY